MKLKPTISTDVTITVYKILSMNRFFVVYHRSQNLFMLRFVFNLRSFSGYYNNNKHNVLIKFDCTDFFLLCVLFHLWSFCDSVTLTFLNQYLFWVNTVDVSLYFLFKKKMFGQIKCFLLIFRSKSLLIALLFFMTMHERNSAFSTLLFINTMNNFVGSL